MAEKDKGQLVINTVVKALFYVYSEIKDMPVDDELSILIDETHFIVGIFYYLFKQYREHLDEVNPMNFKKKLSDHAFAASSWIGW